MISKEHLTMDELVLFLDKELAEDAAAEAERQP